MAKHYRVWWIKEGSISDERFDTCAGALSHARRFGGDAIISRVTVEDVVQWSPVAGEIFYDEAEREAVEEYRSNQ